MFLFSMMSGELCATQHLHTMHFLHKISQCNTIFACRLGIVFGYLQPELDGVKYLKCYLKIRKTVR